MSKSQHQRITKLCDDALKQAALGQPYTLDVSPLGFWPLVTPDGQPMGEGPAWFVLVTIANNLVGKPPIGNGFAVPGVVPPDDLFTMISQALLAKCRNEYDQNIAVTSLAAQREAAKA